MRAPHLRVEPYEINTLECFKEYVKFLKTETTFNPPISKEEYYKRIRGSVIDYARHKGFQRDWTELAKKHLFYIDCNHRSFYFWLAIKISISEIHEIPLMLDHFIKRSELSSNQFVNKIEFDVLGNFITNTIHHNIGEKKIELSKWIRERRKEIDPNEPDNDLPSSNQKTEDFNSENLKFIEQYIDEFTGFDFSNFKENDKVKQEDDDRIRCDTLSTEEIAEYFMKLNQKNRNNEVILEIEDIEHLLRSNFKGFDMHGRKLLKPNTNKQVLMKFIYKFYLKIDTSDYKGRQLEYCKFLVNNFDAFKDDQPEVISKKMSSANPKYYPFT